MRQHVAGVAADNMVAEEEHDTLVEPPSLDPIDRSSCQAAMRGNLMALQPTVATHRFQRQRLRRAVVPYQQSSSDAIDDTHIARE